MEDDRLVEIGIRTPLVVHEFNEQKSMIKLNEKPYVLGKPRLS